MLVERLGAVMKGSLLILQKRGCAIGLVMLMMMMMMGCRTGTRSYPPSAFLVDPDLVPPPPAVVVYADGRVEVEPAAPNPTTARWSKTHYPDERKTPSAVRDYDEVLVEWIEKKWTELARLAKPQTAEVVIEFNLHSDGTVSGLAVAQGESDSMLVDVAKQAILAAAPFPAWPDELRRLIETDRRSIRFTFHYYDGQPVNGPQQ